MICRRGPFPLEELGPGDARGDKRLAAGGFARHTDSRAIDGLGLFSISRRAPSFSRVP